jgi:hypothetical protein
MPQARVPAVRSAGEALHTPSDAPAGGSVCSVQSPSPLSTAACSTRASNAATAAPSMVYSGYLEAVVGRPRPRFWLGLGGEAHWSGQHPAGDSNNTRQ